MYDMKTSCNQFTFMFDTLDNISTFDHWIIIRDVQSSYVFIQCFFFLKDNTLTFTFSFENNIF